MKPIKIEDQKLLSLGEEVREAQVAMHYWTHLYRVNKNRLFNAIEQKYPETKKEPYVYDYDTQTIKSKADSEKRGKEDE